jgi:hypothetical protein
MNSIYNNILTFIDPFERKQSRIVALNENSVLKVLRSKSPKK